MLLNKLIVLEIEIISSLKSSNYEFKQWHIKRSEESIELYRMLKKRWKTSD